MNVDLFVMPLSRYRTGDYTPQVASCRASTDPANCQPAGGSKAPRARRELLRTRGFQQTLSAIEERIMEPLWDEKSKIEPRRYALSSRHLQRLRIETTMLVTGTQLHFVDAEVFIPAAFAIPFEADGIVLGSLPMLREELQAIRFSPRILDAAAMMRRAIDDAIRLRLPLIIADPTLTV